MCGCLLSGGTHLKTFQSYDEDIFLQTKKNIFIMILPNNIRYIFSRKHGLYSV